MEHLIRPASVVDAAAIEPLLGELGYPASAADVVRRLTAMSGADGVVVLVAESSQRVVGVATVQRFPVLHADGDYAQLMLLVVAGAARRRGVGSQLVAAAEDWAIEQRCTRMTVVSGEERTDAHAFYESRGYQHSARRYVKRIGGVR